MWSYEQMANEWIQQVSDEDLIRMQEAELFNGSWEYWASLRDLGDGRTVEQRREVPEFVGMILGDGGNDVR